MVGVEVTPAAARALEGPWGGRVGASHLSRVMSLGLLNIVTEAPLPFSRSASLLRCECAARAR
jgi:hypothetical protein